MDTQKDSTHHTIRAWQPIALAVMRRWWVTHYARHTGNVALTKVPCKPGRGILAKEYV